MTSGIVPVSALRGTPAGTTGLGDLGRAEPQRFEERSSHEYAYEERSIVFGRQERTARVARRDVEPGLVKTPDERPAFDEEFYFEAGQQDAVEHPRNQLTLADGEAPHLCAGGLL